MIDGLWPRILDHAAPGHVTSFDRFYQYLGLQTTRCWKLWSNNDSTMKVEILIYDFWFEKTRVNPLLVRVIYIKRMFLTSSFIRLGQKEAISFYLYYLLHTTSRNDTLLAPSKIEKCVHLCDEKITRYKMTVS